MCNGGRAWPGPGGALTGISFAESAAALNPKHTTGMSRRFRTECIIWSSVLFAASPRAEDRANLFGFDSANTHSVRNRTPKASRGKRH